MYYLLHVSTGFRFKDMKEARSVMGNGKLKRSLRDGKVIFVQVPED